MGIVFIAVKLVWIYTPDSGPHQGAIAASKITREAEFEEDSRLHMRNYSCCHIIHVSASSVGAGCIGRNSSCRQTFHVSASSVIKPTATHAHYSSSWNLNINQLPLFPEKWVATAGGLSDLLKIYCGGSIIREKKGIVLDPSFSFIVTTAIIQYLHENL